MSKRARIAQLEEDLDSPTLTESARSTVHGDEGEDDGRPTLDRGFQVDELLDEPTRDIDEDAGAVDVEILLTPRDPELRATPEGRCGPQGGARAAAVEQTPQGECVGRRRGSVQGRGALGRSSRDVHPARRGDARPRRQRLALHADRAGAARRDERPAASARCVRRGALARSAERGGAERGRGDRRASEGGGASSSRRSSASSANAKTDERAVALCEHRDPVGRGRARTPARGEPFLEQIRQLDPGHPMHPPAPRRHVRREGGAGDSQRESLERALAPREGTTKSGEHCTSCSGS